MENQENKKEEIVEEKEEITEPLNKQPVQEEPVKENIPFLNQKVDKEKTKYFLAGVATTLAVGIIGCLVFGHCGDTQPPTSPINHSSFNQRRDVDNIREHFDKFDKRMEKFIDESIERDNRIREEKRFDKIPSLEGNGFVFQEEQIATPYYKIRIFDNKVKILVLNPERVTVQTETDKKVPNHYFVEKTNKGKIIIHVDKTVDIMIIDNSIN